MWFVGRTTPHHGDSSPEGTEDLRVRRGRRSPDATGRPGMPSSARSGGLMGRRISPRSIAGARSTGYSARARTFPASSTATRHTVLEHNPVRRQRGHAVTREDRAEQVERIGRADRDQRSGARRAPSRAESHDGLRQRKLLAGDAGHESATPDFASRLQATIDPQQLTPRHHETLACQDPVEDHAVTLE